MGYNTVHDSTHHGARKGRADFGVRELPVGRVPLTEVYPDSLWTKYTVAGKHELSSSLPIVSSKAIPGSLIFTMAFLPLYQIIAPALGFSLEYFGTVPRLWTLPVFWFSIILFPFVCLVRDYSWK